MRSLFFRPVRVGQGADKQEGTVAVKIRSGHDAFTVTRGVDESVEGDVVLPRPAAAPAESAREEQETPSWCCRKVARGHKTRGNAPHCGSATTPVVASQRIMPIISMVIAPRTRLHQKVAG